MSNHNKYLDMIGRLRTRLRKMPLSYRRRWVAGITFVFVVIIMSVEISPFGSLVREGKPSPRRILAPRTVQYIDRAKTNEQKDAAAAVVQEVYVYDGSVKLEAERNIDDLFKVINEVDALQVEQGEKARQIRDRLGDNDYVSEVEAVLALTLEQRQLVRDASASVLRKVMAEQIDEGALDEAANSARALAKDISPDRNVQSLAGEIAASSIEPNSVLDIKATDRRKQAARDAVQPVITTRLEGEVIVNKGEVVTAAEVELLKNLGYRRPTFTPINILYYSIFALALLGATSMFLAWNRRNFFDSPGLLGVVGAMVIVFTGVAKVLTVASASWAPFWGYLMPTAAVAIITAVLLDTMVALIVVIVCGMITGIVTGGNFSLTAFALVGGILPALLVSKTSTRHELRRAALYSSLWLAFVALGATALTEIRQELLLHTGIGFLNGAICGIVAVGSLPFLETTFGVTTNPWLLELASPEQQILKELSMKAPGTYSHSVMVANLSEAAAREVGSDPMIARVAAYYHDVGKMKRPQFFVENQPPDRSLHDDISPNLSALIITSHVRDGVEMLERCHIPPDLVEIVKQHHGTGLVRYFYERASDDEGKPADESRFRYHFDKPRGKTAGILLLADAVEATARTIDRPTPSAIEQMVDRIVDSKLEDGQLDDCDLSFSDIRNIKKVFSKNLISTYHPRIYYPSDEVDTGGKRRSTAKDKNRGALGKKRNKIAGQAAEKRTYSDGPGP